MFNVLLISLAYFHLGIKVRTIWISTWTGHDHSVFTFYSRCFGSREITKTKVDTFFWNSLYILWLLLAIGCLSGPNSCLVLLILSRYINILLIILLNLHSGLSCLFVTILTCVRLSNCTAKYITSVCLRVCWYFNI